MKILVLTNNYPAKNALNSGIFIHQQVKALQVAGVECHVLLLHNWFPAFGLQKLHTYWQQGHEVKRHLMAEYEGVKIHAVPMYVRMPARLFKDNYYDRAARAIVQYTRANGLADADWLYAHFLTDNGYIGTKVKEALNMKLAAIARGDDVHAWPERFPELRHNLHRVFERADLLLANSGALAADTQKWMEAGKVRPVQVVYNGIDTTRFCPAKDAREKTALQEKYGLDPTKKYLVCVATPVALKGWGELLEAVRQRGNEMDEWLLLTVAPPRSFDDAMDLKQKCEELGITSRVRHAGGLTPAELTEVLKACDAFVLPSYNEGMANALLEAMASGLPCIATAVGGHAEVMTDGDSGLLIAPRSVTELVVAIKTITGNEDLRKRMGLHARERMIAFGDYPANSGKLLALLKSC